MALIWNTHFKVISVAREGGGFPYTPNLVPQVRLGFDNVELTPEAVQSQLIDLERFLEEELNRIETAMLTAVVQAAYGALVLDNGPAADQPLDDTPTALEGFDNFAPAVPNRVTADITPPGESLVVEEGGIYIPQCQITATIDSGSFYSITMAVNGTLSNVFTSVDASQQTTVVTFTFYGMLALNAGDQITLIAIAQAQGSPHTFIMESAIFSIFRISERNDEPGQF